MSLTRRFLFMLMVPLLIGGVSQNLSAQVPEGPDTLLSIRKLGPEDMASYRLEKKEIIYGASRVPGNSEELPEVTHVISRQEIQENGYSSLTDILKHIPGFRVSQPGTAQLGDLFLQRGLLGNVYTKILVNGIPVSPSGAPGMPLGSQLPIRQAERVEIIMGPAAASYGNDAMAGVINIVMSEIDRPVEARAGVSFGSGGTAEYNLFFGGMAGKNKNVVKYSLMGSTRIMKNQNLNLSSEFEYVDESEADIDELVNNPLWRQNMDSTRARINDLGHESRLIGMALQWQGIELNSQFMFRSDHAAIGAAVFEVGYDNPGNFLAENIGTHRLRFVREFGKFWVNTNASLLTYNVDPNSSFNGILHPLAADLNFQAANSMDLLLEQLVSYQEGRFNIMVGGSYLRKNSDSYQQFLIHPFDESTVREDASTGELYVEVVKSSDTLSNLGSVVEYFENETEQTWSGFGQVRYTGKRWSANVSLRGDSPDGEALQFSPKIGLFAKPWDWLHLRGQYSQGFRDPGFYYERQNFVTAVEPGPPGSTEPEIFFTSINPDSAKLEPESFSSIEFGLSAFAGKHWQFDAHFFTQLLNNSLFLQIDSLPPPPPVGGTPAMARVGYYNANSYSALTGIQVRVKANYPLMDGPKQVGSIVGEAFGQYSLGEEEIEGILDRTSDYRGIPTWMGQFNFHFRMKKWFNLSVYNQFFGASNGAVVKIRDAVINRYSEGFYNMDIVIGRKLIDRLYCYARVDNVTNSVAKGLYGTGFTGWGNDYIPQRNTMAYFGVNFSLD